MAGTLLSEVTGLAGLSGVAQKQTKRSGVRHVAGDVSVASA
ncbi:hypothetical protein PAJL_1159 [Cutibacterium acnes HL042PA3]|nr:hypothetical protein HMPREF9619_01915 [Cutibacterium acnes HL082PA2]EFT77043.1 hypothetical protein HMPREF9599_01770 [Cutibacterium acnes HL050PA2]EGE70896.1 hypothetical protein HMPREF9341_00607 [Cutibacterium acnes HL103PA1]ESK59151.1 hypothetical protein PAJL_1159 [Cutibacterium acnes HL042PA3]